MSDGTAYHLIPDLTTSLRRCLIQRAYARIPAMPDMNDIKYWVALNRVPQLGPVRFKRLEAHFGLLEHAWNAGLAQLRAAGLEDRPAQEVLAARARVDPDAEMERLGKAEVRVLDWNHAVYPRRLKEIHDPPPLLYVKGDILPEDERSLAIVGTRSPTTYGREVASTLATGLANSGICIISGLARGIDGIAHRATLDAGGRTIAVVANGLDMVYPGEHTELARQIQAHGAVVSEYPLGVRPDAKGFPRRNRLISGMSLGSLVVEAAEGSGARWTVYHALEQDREVFCVPGSIFSPASSFTNRMIQEGAKLVSNHRDVLEELNLGALGQPVAARQGELSFDPTKSDAAKPDPAKLNPAKPGSSDSDRQEPVVYAAASTEPLDPEEAAILQHIEGEPLHIDDLGRKAGLPITSVSCVLTMLELKGMVKQVGCMHYIRTREVAGVYAR